MIGRRAVRNVNRVLGDVDVIKEMLAHEMAEALRMISFQSDVFVEIERRHPGEVNLAFCDHTGEFVIQAEWRAAGCSMCLAMNPDKLEGDQLCASSSNRNFIGRQGSITGRTVLMSPVMVMAAAVTGEISDAREVFGMQERMAA